jgi:RNA polymerase-binding transcription factor DksA
MPVNVHQTALRLELLERGLLHIYPDCDMDRHLKRFELCLQRVAAGWPLGAAAEKAELAPDDARTVSRLQVCYRPGPEGGPAEDKEHVAAFWLAVSMWQNSTTNWSTRQNRPLTEALLDECYLDYLGRRTLLVANKFAADDLLVLSCLQYHGNLPPPADLAGTLAHPGSSLELDLLMRDLENETGNAHGTTTYIAEDFRSAARRVRSQEPETFVVKGRKYDLKSADYRDSQSGGGCLLGEYLLLEARRISPEGPPSVGGKARSARGRRRRAASPASPRKTGAQSAGVLRRQLERERMRREHVEKELSAARRENMRLQKEQLTEKAKARALAARQQATEKVRRAAEAQAREAVANEKIAAREAKEAARLAARLAARAAIETARHARKQQEKAMTMPVRLPIIKFEPVDGITPTKDFDLAFLRSQRAALVAKSAELLGQAKRLEQAALTGVISPEMGDVAFSEGDTMAVGHAHDPILSVHEARSEVDAALKRIEIGEYGYSLHSGLPIPRERLRVQPLAELLIVELRTSHKAETLGHS